MLGNVTDPNYYFGDYTQGPLSNYDKIQAYINANPGAVVLNVNATHQRSDPNNYRTTERVYAGYAMNTFGFKNARGCKRACGLKPHNQDSPGTR